MTDETPDAPMSDARLAADPPTAPGLDAAPPDGDRPPAAPASGGRSRRPEYKGEELDPERGPGLGCFWFQVIVLGIFLVLIPVGLNLGWPYEVLAVLLFIVIGLLLFTGQTVIFLLRLVAADRRTQGRRRPLASPTKTVGEIEDEHRVAHAVGRVPVAQGAPAAAEPTGPDAVAEPEPAGSAEPLEAVAEPGAAHAEPGAAAEPPEPDAAEAAAEGEPSAAEPPEPDAAEVSAEGDPSALEPPQPAAPADAAMPEIAGAADDTLATAPAGEGERPAAEPPEPSAVEPPGPPEDPDPGVRQ